MVKKTVLTIKIIPIAYNHQVFCHKNHIGQVSGTRLVLDLFGLRLAVQSLGTMGSTVFDMAIGTWYPTHWGPQTIAKLGAT